MNSTALKDYISTFWDNEILPTLCDYIRIPCVSPLFDDEWKSRGFMDAAINLFVTWAEEKIIKLSGATIDVLHEPGRTPLIFIDVPGKTKETVLLYGHLDKQPETSGWSEGLGPWTPVIKSSKLYGRGSADDGYAMFAALSALLALEAHNLPHARCVIVIEAAEESGSFDMPFYMERLKDRIGAVDLVICLDSGAGTFDRLWLTTSLRGLVAGTLKVSVLNNGQHSGQVSGIVPSSFRILRMLLSRIEDEATGEIKLPSAFVKVPSERMRQIEVTAEILGNSVFSDIPFSGNTKPMVSTPVEMILNQTWKPQLAVVAFDGYPKPENAGNVLLPYTRAKLSMRIPPCCDGIAIAHALKQELEKNPPYDSDVSFELQAERSGWNAPTFCPWLEEALNRASSTHFGKPAAFIGEGGSINFMVLLSEKFPQAQFIVTGVCGPDSNIHGADENLDISVAKRLSACIAEILAIQASR
ncbi:MAG: M20/M25/M40 family metallo-hydrolase [Bdellovibrionales bacterium]